MIVEVCLLWCHQKKTTTNPQVRKKRAWFCSLAQLFSSSKRVLFFLLLFFNIIQQELNILFPGYLWFSWLIKYFINKDMAVGRMCDLKKKTLLFATATTPVVHPKSPHAEVPLLGVERAIRRNSGFSYFDSVHGWSCRCGTPASFTVSTAGSL